jgi:hypothetical protein
MKGSGHCVLRPAMSPLPHDVRTIVRTSQDWLTLILGTWHVLCFLYNNVKLDMHSS